jgi:PadR family transcriptional regulator PadR
METIGTLEEIILMILLQGEKLNSVDIAKQYEGSLSKSISIPAIHVVLKRMEKKGWVKSEFGSPTAERGGRRKRVYWATSQGYDIIQALNEVKTKMWQSVTKPTLEFIRI